jgi:putative DNA primase/helicase
VIDPAAATTEETVNAPENLVDLDFETPNPSNGETPMTDYLQTGKTRTKGTKKQFPPELLIVLNNPTGTAQKFLDWRNKRLRHYRGQFYEWTGTHYSAISLSDIRAELYHFLTEVAKARTEEGLMKPNPNSRHVGHILDALASGKAHLASKIKAPAWLPGAHPEIVSKNRAEDMLALSNGLLNLVTGELLPHTPEFFTMNATDYAFAPSAKAPRWEQFVAETLPDDTEAQNALQELMGYTATADTSQQKMAALIGKKRSGKGTIAYVMGRLIGPENVAHPPMDSLRDRFGLEDLIGKKLAVIPDARFEARAQGLVERLLAISGEDPIGIERKGISERGDARGLRIWLLSNEIPKFTDASGTIAHRFILIRFAQSFFGREDTALRDKLSAELPGILNWAIEGLRRLRDRGHFVQPGSSTVLIQLMEDIASPTKACIRELFDIGPDLSMDRDACFDLIATWREENGHSKMSKKGIERELAAIDPGIQVKRFGPRGNQTWRVEGLATIKIAVRARKGKQPGQGTETVVSLRDDAVPTGRKLKRVRVDQPPKEHRV